MQLSGDTLHLQAVVVHEPEMDLVESTIANLEAIAIQRFIWESRSYRRSDCWSPNDYL